MKLVRVSPALHKRITGYAAQTKRSFEGLIELAILAGLKVIRANDKRLQMDEDNT